jgi:hypothetical protein
VYAAYLNLATYSEQQHNYEKAVYFFERCHGIAVAASDLHGELEATLHLGAAHDALGDTPQVRVLQKSLPHAVLTSKQLSFPGGVDARTGGTQREPESRSVRETRGRPLPPSCAHCASQCLLMNGRICFSRCPLSVRRCAVSNAHVADAAVSCRLLCPLCAERSPSITARIAPPPKRTNLLA